MQSPIHTKPFQGGLPEPLWTMQRSWSSCPYHWQTKVSRAHLRPTQWRTYVDQSSEEFVAASVNGNYVQLEHSKGRLDSTELLVQVFRRRWAYRQYAHMVSWVRRRRRRLARNKIPFSHLLEGKVSSRGNLGNSW